MASPSTSMKWNAGLYNQKYDFVFKFGEDLVQLLDSKPGERILDLGCGTGYLTERIASTGASVIGIDNSEEMIRKAKATYPSISFEVKNAASFQFEQPFDAIFSNAVLHWIPEKEKVADCVFHNLKSGGRLVLEMGGKDNVKTIIDALTEVLSQHGYNDLAKRKVWYFPSLGEYASLLEHHGLTVNFATYFKRVTELKDNENGIIDWMRMFGSAYLKGVDEQELNGILEEVQEQLRSTNYRNEKWYADYQRLRIVATKP
jgi:trans-aconitate methyltransferase